MAIKFSVEARNAMLDAIETAAGTSAIMKLRTGAPPTNITDADSGTVVSTINLPSDWMAAAASGVKSKSGTWDDTSADAAGTLGHYRLYKNDGTTVVSQGTITATGGGGDMTVDNTVVASGQQVTITAFSWTAPNA